MPGLKSLLNTLRKHEGKILTPIMDRKLLERNSKPPHVDGFIHPSSVGRFEDLCPREIFFSLFTPIAKYPVDLLDQGATARSHRIFDNGDMLHLRYQALFVEAGIMHPRKGVGWEIPIENTENLIRGHSDGIVYPEAVNTVTLRKMPSGRGTTSVPLLCETGFDYAVAEENAWKPKGRPYMLEIKSMNERWFERLLEPLPEHKMQATLYMSELRKKFPDLVGTIFIYENKNTQEPKEYLFPFHLPAWSQISKTVETVLTHRKREKALPKGVCPDSFSDRADNCPWMNLCFSTNTFSELVNIGAANATKVSGKAKRSRRR